MIISPSMALHAQAPDELSVVDSLFRQFERAATAAELPAMESCEPFAGSVKRACQGLHALRRAESTKQIKDIADARDRWERVVGERPKWAVAWYALGRVRMAAEHADLVSREGPLQQFGQTNTTGANAVFLQALKVDDTFAPAANALAVTPITWTDKDGLRARVALLRTYRKLLTPVAWVGEAVFELDEGSVDTAIVLLRDALKSADDKVPRGYANLTLARALYRAGKPKEGRAAMLAGATATDSAGLAEYRFQISAVGDSAEMKQWAALPPARRPEWLTAFWAVRDAREGRQEGERLTEHFRRVNVAYERYRTKFALSGRPTTITSLGENDYQRRLLAEGAKYPSREGQQIHDYALSRIFFGAQNPAYSFKSGQTELDDRGMIFIRHGEPTKMAISTVGSIQIDTLHKPARIDKFGNEVEGDWNPLDKTTFAVWRYDNNGLPSPLLLYFRSVPFSGSVEATVLVPTLLGEDPETRSAFCNLDGRLCTSGTSLVLEIFTDKMSFQNMAASRDRGRAMIKEAVTSDAFPRIFSKIIDGSFDFHVLDQAQPGSPRAVVAFALPGEDLLLDTTTSSPSYPVRMDLIAVRHSDGLRVDANDVRSFAASHRLVKGEWVFALTELPLPPGIWTLSVVLTQRNAQGVEERGVKATVDRLAVPDWTTRLTVSDLVLGREDVALRWHSGPGGQAVPMNPLHTYRSGATATLYGQIGGLTPGEDYKAKIEIFEGREVKGTPKLTIDFAALATASRAEISRSIDLKNLSSGKHLVRLTITVNGKSQSGTGGFEILKP